MKKKQEEELLVYSTIQTGGEKIAASQRNVFHFKKLFIKKERKINKLKKFTTSAQEKYTKLSSSLGEEF